MKKTLISVVKEAKLLCTQFHRPLRKTVLNLSRRTEFTLTFFKKYTEIQHHITTDKIMQITYQLFTQTISIGN